MLALLIVGSSFWYTNRLVQKIAKEERKQVQLWAGAIEKKANLVKYTNKLFKELQAEERKKVELWSDATKSLINAKEIKLALRVVESNTTIPIILTNGEGNYTTYRNISGVIEFDKDTLSEPELARIEAHNDSVVHRTLTEMKEEGRKIDINYYGQDVNYLYYKDSRLFEELKSTFNDLQVSFISEVVTNSASTPVIFTNVERDSVIATGNIDSSVIENHDKFLKQLKDMEAQNKPISVELGDNETFMIFYEDSALLTQLKYYPFIQFFVIGLFILIGYWLFSISRKSEQNQVWVGMSKETAHQLGTPLSSLLAWLEVLRSKDVSPKLIGEMERDVGRLQVITERFSKIGSTPDLKEENINLLIEDFVEYLETRLSKKVNFTVHASKDEPRAPVNRALFGWVVENLCKNAVDAMGGNGSIDITIEAKEDNVIIDVKDTGKGIPANKRKEVFQPGYTSKKRGWGLGLSLSKRIIENYHRGRIFVKQSEPGKGTTFRIILNS